VETENLFIESTAKTPQFDFNQHTGELILSGRSIPENATVLYDKVLKWTHKYIKNPRRTTNLRLNLEYFNTSSSIWIAKIIKALSTIKNDEYTLLVHLYLDIEEYNNMDTDDLTEEISPIIDMIGIPDVSLGIKVHGINTKGEILKESMVLI